MYPDNSLSASSLISFPFPSTPPPPWQSPSWIFDFRFCLGICLEVIYLTIGSTLSIGTWWGYQWAQN